MAIIDAPSVLVARDENRAVLTINRPANLNALNPDVLQSLILALEEVRRDPELRVVTITGEGPKSFVAGADIAAMATLAGRGIAEYIELGQRAMRAVETFPAPVIGAVNGYALGGGLELALSCDLIIAADTAKLGQPEVNLGIIPGFGGTQRLIHRCGVGVAKRLCLTGDLLGASEAFQCGLVDKVVPAADLVAEASAWAKSIAAKAPLAVREAKRIIREAHEPLLLSGLRKEVESFLALFLTRDREEGMSAFVEKRAPKWSGR
jgi:enoyl-CoA hydratase